MWAKAVKRKRPFEQLHEAVFAWSSTQQVTVTVSPFLWLISFSICHQVWIFLWYLENVSIKPPSNTMGCWFHSDPAVIRPYLCQCSSLMWEISSSVWLLHCSDCRSQVCVNMHRYPMIPLKPHNNRNNNRNFRAQTYFSDTFPPEYVWLYLSLGVPPTPSLCPSSPPGIFFLWVLINVLRRFETL